MNNEPAVEVLGEHLDVASPDDALYDANRSQTILLIVMHLHEALKAIDASIDFDQVVR